MAINFFADVIRNKEIYLSKKYFEKVNLFSISFAALRDDMELYAISSGMVFPKLVSVRKTNKQTRERTDKQSDRRGRTDVNSNQ